jgi:hypothetical protein
MDDKSSILDVDGSSALEVECGPRELEHEESSGTFCRPAPIHLLYPRCCSRRCRCRSPHWRHFQQRLPRPIDLMSQARPPAVVLVQGSPNTQDKKRGAGLLPNNRTRRTFRRGLAGARGPRLQGRDGRRANASRQSPDENPRRKTGRRVLWVAFWVRGESLSLFLACGVPFAAFACAVSLSQELLPLIPT